MKPKGMSDHAEQLRPPIVRGTGVTASERYLAKLGEKSFLNLWSYPNTFRNQMDNPGASQGKELCDLLVVCAPHIIIFSEKTIAWQADKPTPVAWSRWFRGAVGDSVKQVRGAERWITQHPDRIFLDPACRNPLPIALPPPDERIIHRVVVAQGAAGACRQHFGRGRGSLHIRPDIKGTAHFDTKGDHAVEPFCVGDVDPLGPFVHVLDEASLDIAMHELNTIIDFTAYLAKKEAFIRAGRLAKVGGEEDLIAYYAVRINEEGDHDFTHPSGGAWPAGEAITIDSGRYDAFAHDPQYIAKKRADRDGRRVAEQTLGHALGEDDRAGLRHRGFGIAGDGREVEHVEQMRVADVEGLLRARPVDVDDGSLGHDAGGDEPVAEVRVQEVGRRVRRIRPRPDRLAGQPELGVHPIEPVGIGEIVFVGELVAHIERDQKARRDRDGEAHDIDRCVPRVAEDRAER